MSNKSFQVYFQIEKNLNWSIVVSIPSQSFHFMTKPVEEVNDGSSNIGY